MRIDIAEIVAPVLADRQRWGLVHILAIDVIRKRYRTPYEFFANAERGIGQNDVGLLRRLDEVRPKRRNRRLAFPDIQEFAHGAILLHLPDPGGCEEKAHRSPHEMRPVV